MNPITSFAGGVGTPKQLEKYLLETCEKHKEDGRALVFAFLCFDFTDAHITKVLKDTDYWNSLHDISGNWLTVFFIDHREKKQPLSLDSQKFFGLKRPPQAPYVVFFQTKDKSISDAFFVELKKDEMNPAFTELNRKIKAAVGTLEQVHPVNYENADQLYALIEKSIKSDNSLLKYIGSKIVGAGIIAAIKYVIDVIPSQE